MRAVVLIASATEPGLAPGITEEGEKLQAAPDGNPAHAKLPTAKLNGGGFGATVIVQDADAPAFIVWGPVALSEKLALLTTCGSVRDELTAECGSPPNCAVRE